MKQKTGDYSEVQLARLALAAQLRGIGQGELLRRALDLLLDSYQVPFPSTSPAPAQHQPAGADNPEPKHQPAHQHGHQPTGALGEPLGGGLSVSSGEGGGSLETVPSSRKRKGSGETKRSPPPEPEIPPELDTPTGREAVRLWLEYKRERGQSYKSRTGLRELIGKLAAWGPERALAAVRHSMAENYAGCFEPKENGNGKGPYLPLVPERPYLDPFWRAFFDDPAGEKRTARVARALESQGATLAPEQRAEVERLDRETP